MSGVQKLFPGAHLAIAVGTGEQNRAYCTKEDTRAEPGFHEFGEVPVQGKRNDLREFYTAVKSGKSEADLLDDFADVFIRYPRGVDRVRSILARVQIPKVRNLYVEVRWGPTGTGKTWSAVHENEKCFLWHASEPEWWDGYLGEQVVVIDEYRHQLKCHRLLQILDPYECRLPVKCGHTYAAWTKVIITSNLSPDQWYPNVDELTKQALMRRIHKITEMNVPYQLEIQERKSPVVHHLNAGAIATPIFLTDPPSLRILREAIEKEKDEFDVQNEEYWDNVFSEME